MSSKASPDEPSYFLFRFNTPREWLLLTFVPDGVAVCSSIMILLLLLLFNTIVIFVELCMYRTALPSTYM